MPLRVAEKDGYLYAVNGCGHCPFNGWDGHMITQCKHEKSEDQDLLYSDAIPVWCPLPESGQKANRPSMKEVDGKLKKQGLGG